MSDPVDRQAAIDAFLTELTKRERKNLLHTWSTVEVKYFVVDMLEKLPAAQQEQHWIPFTGHVPESDEKELYPGYDFILDGKLPEDGQRILVTIKKPGHESVQADEFYMDSTECYLDSEYEIRTEAIAWMPLPEPYKAERREE